MNMCTSMITSPRIADKVLVALAGALFVVLVAIVPPCVCRIWCIAQGTNSCDIVSKIYIIADIGQFFVSRLGVRVRSSYFNVYLLEFVV